MLVYANSLHVPPETGSADCILNAIDSWLLFKTRKSLTATAHINKPLIRLADGKELEVLLSGDATKGQAVTGSVVFSHPDGVVSGRKWFTRVGFQQSVGGKPAFVTVVLETSDISAQAGASRVFATRPGVIRNLVSKCGVISPTPAAAVFSLTPESAITLSAEVGAPDRQHAIIVISPEPFSERCFVNPQELLHQVVGLARVSVISNKAHTREVSEILGRKYSAWGGAVNVIMPPLRNGFVANHLIPLEQLRYETGRDRSPENYLLFLLTHRLNLPHYQQEITPASVRQNALTLKLNELKNNQSSIEQLQEMVQVVQAQIAQKDEQVQRLQDENGKAWAEWEESEKRANEIPQLRSQVESYKAAFETMKKQGRLRAGDALPITCVADAMQAASEEFDEILVFSLNTKSDGDGSPFQPAEEVFQAFKWLAGVYGPSRLGTKRCANLDHSIRERIPGWAYSAKQSDLTSGRFEEWYECHWEGRTYRVEEHVGCGTTTRPEETIRVAFAWDKDRKKVVVGFIGQHQRNTKS